jgi:lipocalin
LSKKSKSHKQNLDGTKYAQPNGNTTKLHIMNKSIIIGGAAFVVVLIAAIGTLIAKGRGTKGNIDNSTVDSVNLDKYLGTWYEIARFDHPFERNLELVTANYSLNPNGTIKVTNSGYKTTSGKYKESVGRARTIKGKPGELEVTFFLNFWSPYKIMELAPDYSYVLVGSNTDQYLWILSRTPTLSAKTTQEILALAEARGYDTSKLIWVKQH